MNAARSQWIAVGLIVAGLSGALIAGVALSEDIFPVAVGSRAPDFDAKNLATGDSVALADYENDVVVLNLWATWCAPCREEMPALERLHRELGPDGLKIVAVSVDAVGEEQVQEFVDEFGLTFDILHDRSQRVEAIYQTTGLPETFILDRRGTIVKKEIGAIEWDSAPYKAFIRRLLEDGSATVPASP